MTKDKEIDGLRAKLRTLSHPKNTQSTLIQTQEDEFELPISNTGYAISASGFGDFS